MTCQGCIAGYYLNNNNNCTICPGSPQCIQCDSATPSTCEKCSPGFYLPTGSTTCSACPNNCETCTSTGSNPPVVSCKTFKESTGQILVQIGTQTVPGTCDSGCKKCQVDEPSNCLVCSSGFALDSTSLICIPCPSTCRECVYSGTSESGELNFQCTSCYSNGYLNGGQCQSCASNCLTCQKNNLATCTSCPVGSYLENSSCVKGCPSNCVSCSSSSKCTTCVSGFAVNGAGVCVPCLSSCRECATQAPGQCLSCGDGLFLNSQQKCQQCSTSFCSTCSINDVCESCSSGYTLTSTFTCIKNCESPCATCSASSPTQCTSCLAGYEIDSTTSSCTPVTQCIGGCNVCPTGYVLSESICVQCTNSKCLRCSASDPSVCTSCINGLYLSSNQVCTTCPSGCATCSSSTNCLTCSSGFTLLSESVQGSQQKCVQCASPCSQCMNNPSNCLSCVSGYSLSGWKCISNFNYQVEMTLGVDPTDFYNNYPAFLQALANTISSNANINLVSVNSIEQGSTVVNSQIITNADSGSSEADNQFTSLDSLTSEGQSIAGMQVEKSSLTVNGGSADDESGGSSVNLGLILGICIPVGVILIGVIIYCIIKKRNAKEITEKDLYPNTGRGIREDFEMEASKENRYL